MKINSHSITSFVSKTETENFYRKEEKESGGQMSASVQ